MTGNIDSNNQCFFTTCHREAVEHIIFKRQRVKVCKTHGKQYGYSNEHGSKRSHG